MGKVVLAFVQLAQGVLTHLVHVHQHNLGVVGHDRVDVAGHAHVQDEQRLIPVHHVWRDGVPLGSGGDNQHPGLADGRGQPVEGRWGEPVHVRRVSGLGFVAVDHGDGRLAGVLRKVLACVSAQFAESKQHHLHPFQARQVVAHALHGAEGDRRRTGAQPRLRLHPLAGLEHQRHHAVQPRDVPAEVLGLAQRQLQLTCDFRIAWNLGFERAAHAEQMRHSLHAINGKLGSGPRVVVHGHVRLNHVVGMVRLQVRPVHLSAVAGGKHHRVVGPLGVQRREQLSLGFGGQGEGVARAGFSLLEGKTQRLKRPQHLVHTCHCGKTRGVFSWEGPSHCPRFVKRDGRGHEGL